MALDVVPLNPGTGGANVSVDKINGVAVQVVKVAHGAEGTSTPASSAAPLPTADAAANASLDAIEAGVGAPGDAAASTDAGTFSLIALVKRLLGKLPASLGQKAAANSLAVVVASDQSAVPSKVQDGAGNAITSTLINTKQRLDVNLASGAAPGSAAPTFADLMGGSDGTNLRALSVDATGALNVRAFAARAGSSTAATAIVTATNGVAANTDRRSLMVISPSTNTATVWVNCWGTATTAPPSIPLLPGQRLVADGTSVPSGAVSIIAASGSQPVTIVEG